MERKQTSYGSDWKKELAKISVVAITALLCLYRLLYSPTFWNMILSVVMIATVSWICEWKSVVDKYPLKNRAVLITGCDTGFGYELALSLSDQGAVVFAGCLYSHGEGAKQLKLNRPASRMHIIQMDVSNIEEIEEAEYYVRNRLRDEGLWGVVNNAGLNFLGDIELTTMEQFEKVNNINYLGVVRVTKTFLPLVRKAKGRFVNITSVKGLFSEIFNGAYGPTKYACEAFTDILRMEMKKFDIKVCAVEPCNFGGGTRCIEYTRMKKDMDVMWASLSKEKQELYSREYLDHHLQNIKDAQSLGSHDTYLVTDAIEDALFNMKPKNRYLIPGGKGLIEPYRWKAYLKPFLPDWLMDKWLLGDLKHFPKLKGL